MKSLFKIKPILQMRMNLKLIVSRLSSMSRNACVLNPDGNNGLSHDEMKVSTLFVPGKHGGSMYQIIKPIIDFNYIKENLKNIENSCKSRGIEFDGQYLLKVLNEWDIKKEYHLNISNQFKELKDEAKRLKDLEMIDEGNALTEQSNELLDKIKEAKEELYDIEDLAMPLLAKIPNLLDSLTPLHHDSINVQIEPAKSSVKSLSHEILGQKHDLLEFIDVSPTAYYLKGSFAELELSIEDYFSDKCLKEGFAPMSCIDFVKSFIIEATGLDPYSSDESIPLQNNKATTKFFQSLHLVGGASFQPFCAYFINMNTAIETLPARYYSIGRHYDASHRNSPDHSLFSVVQSSSIHSVILDDPVNKNTEFNSMFKHLVSCYSLLKIPFRTVEVAAFKLNCTESRRIEIELWSPAQLKYVSVAHVSQRTDFVSKLLHISFGVKHSINGYCNIVEGKVVNIPVLLGCLVENYSDAKGTIDYDSIYKLFE